MCLIFDWCLLLGQLSSLFGSCRSNLLEYFALNWGVWALWVEHQNVVGRKQWHQSEEGERPRHGGGKDRGKEKCSIPAGSLGTNGNRFSHVPGAPSSRGTWTSQREINSNKRLASASHRLQQKPSQRSTRELYEQWNLAEGTSISGQICNKTLATFFHHVCAVIQQIHHS